MKRIFRTMALATAFAVLFSAAAFAQDAEAVVEAEDTAEVATEPAEPVAEPAPAPVVEVPAVPGVQTLFSQVFVDAAFKEIDIDLVSEEFTLVTTGADAVTLEIKSNVKENVPLVVQDGKSLKVTQKNKKAKTPSRYCAVILTIPQNYPPAKFELSLVDGKATFDTFAAGEVEFSAGNGSIIAKEIRADKEFELSVGSGKALLDTVFAGEVEVSADTGAVAVQGIRAERKLSVAAANGNVEIQQLETKTLAATAKKGTLTLRNVSTEDFAVSADKGTAVVELAKSFSKASSVNVSTGSLNLVVPATAVLYDTVSVGKGRYRSEFPSDTNGPELKGKIGKGSITVSKR